MVLQRLGKLVAVLAVLVGSLGVARAADPGARSGALLAARLDLQQRMDEWLGRSLAMVADPYRFGVSTQIEVRGELRDVVQRDETPGSEMKIAPATTTQSLKLPGLGVVMKAVEGSAAPDISVKIPGRKTSLVRRELETEISRVTVRLFVEPRMPADRRELVAKIATDLVGLDLARGDALQIRELGTDPVQPPQTIHLARVYPWTLAALCLTALVCALVLALAVGRLGRGRREVLEVGGRPGAADGQAGAAPEGTTTATGERAARTGPRAFRALDDAGPDELVKLLGELPPGTAAVVLDLLDLPAAVARVFFERQPRERRLDIAGLIGATRILPVTALREMEDAAEATLARIRSTVAVGGPSRLATLLMHAPEKEQHALLEQIAARSPELASAVRDELLLFEDLPQLTDADVRQVVTGIDPAVLATALVGAADEIRSSVQRVLSKRLRTIVDVEVETMGEKTAAEIDAARKAVEGAMRRVQPVRQPRAKERAA